ncbi:MAG: DUF3473 domain-containing protein [Bacteroidetes bacterium]|nr:MAG: DUF3473 domain-containing protein [Bacteroidota bacterium]
MNQNSKIALSFDVEDWYHTPAITGSSFSFYRSVDDFFENWKGEYDCLSDGFHYLIDLLKKHDVRATFFIVADVMDRYPEVVRALKNSNHEIACHSLHHTSAIDAKTKKPFQAMDVWEKELILAKQKIETVFGMKATGYRAPNAYFGKWMVKLLERNGFLYDSSIAYNSMYNKTDVSLKNVPSVPYRMNAGDLSNVNADSTIVELPWSYLKTGPFYLPGGGAFFYRALGNSYFNILLSQCLKMGDTMFYIHPLDFSNTDIPLSNNMARPMYWINKGYKTRKMFEKFIIRHKEKFATCRDVYSRFISLN